MLINVCGLRDADNIRAVSDLHIDMIGFIFCPQSPQFVRMISARSGIVPDYSEERFRALKKNKTKDSEDDNFTASHTPKRVGVFMDDMPQNIITRIYNYNLDYVQLHGEESSILIDNLKMSVVPDIHKELKVIKAISITDNKDFEKWREYKGHADMLLFDMKRDCDKCHGNKLQDYSILDNYDGNIPFLLSCEFGLEDAETVKKLSHPMLAGIEINSMFETEPGVKDIEKLRAFVEKIRS
ncbi:MAG: phosphoribosylanthranilate isomerase [Prevotellaceae bacterium]|nr:phosphoribosylanthranilate isomerase [Prevotellaceae bacterium]